MDGEFRPGMNVDLAWADYCFDRHLEMLMRQRKSGKRKFLPMWQSRRNLSQLPWRDDMER